MTEPFHREVVSFTRRGGRLTERRQKAWDESADFYVVEPPRTNSDTSVDPAYRFDPEAVFGRRAPLVLDIGTGRGESLVHAAKKHPDHDFLGLEVYVPGVAQTLVSARHEDVTNIRLMVVDAVPALTTMLAPRSVAEVRLFFPDPWQKSRHHKRRIVNAEFAALVARVLEPGGVWRLATDWEHYAEQMHEVLTQTPHFDFSGDWSERFEDRPLTRFEQRGIAEGRTIRDLTARLRLQP